MTHAPAPTLAAIVADLRHGSALDRARIEKAAGARLSLLSENDAFSFYGGRSRTADHVAVELDFREPRPGGGATAGPMLNLMLTGGCQTRPEVEKAFGPLHVAGVPTGRSEDEELSLTRSEPWGRLSFGFADRTPECLTTITFAYDR